MTYLGRFWTNFSHRKFFILVRIRIWAVSVWNFKSLPRFSFLFLFLLTMFFIRGLIYIPAFRWWRWKVVGALLFPPLRLLYRRCWWVFIFVFSTYYVISWVRVVAFVRQKGSWIARIGVISTWLKIVAHILFSYILSLNFWNNIMNDVADKGYSVRAS